MKYYDLVANWPKIEPLLSHPKVQEAISENYNRFSLGHLGVSFVGMTIEQCYELKQRTEYGDDWKQEGFDSRHGERQPYWVITCPNSCHWSANVNLEIAKLVEPDRPWRIISGKKHSTVWDGAETLFETHYFVINHIAQDCYDDAKVDSTESEIGEQEYASAPTPWFVPDWFEAKNYKQFDMKAIAADASRYLNNLIESFQNGTSADDVSLLAIYDLTKQFIQAVKDIRRTRSAKLLQQLRDFEYEESLNAVSKKVNQVADTILKKVNPGYNVGIGRPQEILKGTARSAYTITESGIENVFEKDDKAPLETLRSDIRYAACYQWGWGVFLTNDKTGEPHSFWTFKNFRATEWEPSKVWDFIPEAAEKAA